MRREISLTVGEAAFVAELELNAPETLAWLDTRLPFDGQALHARWSGEAAWVRLGDQLDIPPENATAHPPPGALLLYPGGLSEPEILIPYGACAFASQAGGLAGNHFATIRRDLALLRDACQATLLHGAQPLRIDRMS
jgi:hypothetical protein